MYSQQSYREPCLFFFIILVDILLIGSVNLPWPHAFRQHEQRNARVEAIFFYLCSVLLKWLLSSTSWRDIFHCWHWCKAFHHIWGWPEDTSTVALSFNGFPFLFEATTNSPPPPMSCVSITGNNRTSSFIIGWRWFPHGANGSLWCQSASRPVGHSTLRRSERENQVYAPAFSFPYRPQRGDLTHGPAAPLIGWIIPANPEWMLAHFLVANNSVIKS